MFHLFPVHVLPTTRSSGISLVVVLHGGPGAGHEYLLPFTEIWSRYRFPVLFYDQIGCAGSTRLPQTAGDEFFWQESLFLDELDNLLDHFQLRAADGPGYHIFGHSFGGRLAAAYATRRPPGLRKLILASGLASTELAELGKKLLIEQLPSDVRQAFSEAERSSDFTSHAYSSAMGVYMKTYLCRADPFPPEELKPAMKHIAEDKTVERAMYGSTGMKITGSLRGWTCIPRLPNINVSTLIYNAQHDTSHDVATSPFFEFIPRSRWVTFADAGHMCHIEGEELREKVLEVVGEFLTEDEKAEQHIHSVV